MVHDKKDKNDNDNLDDDDDLDDDDSLDDDDNLDDDENLDDDDRLDDDDNLDDDENLDDDDSLDNDDSLDDDENLDDDDLDGEKADHSDLDERSQPDRGDRTRRMGRIFLLIVVAIPAVVYGFNGYLNVSTADMVREQCWVEDQRLSETIIAASNDKIPALDWMVSLYRARRRYVQELCDDTVVQLSWWRWNLSRDIEADISPHTQQDIAKVLARAALSCEHEIKTMEKLFNSELERRGADPNVKAQVEEMISGHLESCHEFRSAVEVARPGFWPPLKAAGQADIPTKLGALMPQALQMLPQEREQQ